MPKHVRATRLIVVGSEVGMAYSPPALTFPRIGITMLQTRNMTPALRASILYRLDFFILILTERRRSAIPYSS